MGFRVIIYYNIPWGPGGLLYIFYIGSQSNFPENAPWVLSSFKVCGRGEGGGVMHLTDSYVWVHLSYKLNIRMFIKILEYLRCRAVKSKEMTMQFYDLATDFYEYGWGESFHFYTMSKSESRQLSCAKHEYRLALNLGLKPGHKVLVSIF